MIKIHISKRIWSILLLCAMLITMLPISAVAADPAEYDPAEEEIQPLSDDALCIDLSKGRVEITDEGYKQYDGLTTEVVEERSHTGAYILTGTLDLANTGTYKKVAITISSASNKTFDITLNNLSVTLTHSYTTTSQVYSGLMQVNSGSIALTVEGTNTLTAKTTGDKNPSSPVIACGAPIIRVMKGDLTITGDGTLTLDNQDSNEKRDFSGGIQIHAGSMTVDMTGTLNIHVATPSASHITCGELDYSSKNLPGMDEDDPDQGNLVIQSGTINLGGESNGDLEAGTGITAKRKLEISGGTVTVFSQKASLSAAASQNSNFGTLIITGADTVVSVKNSDSRNYYQTVAAKENMIVNGGATLNVIATGKAIGISVGATQAAEPYVQIGESHITVNTASDCMELYCTLEINDGAVVDLTSSGANGIHNWIDYGRSNGYPCIIEDCTLTISAGNSGILYQVANEGSKLEFGDGAVVTVKKGKAGISSTADIIIGGDAQILMDGSFSSGCIIGSQNIAIKDDAFVKALNSSTPNAIGAEGDITINCAELVASGTAAVKGRSITITGMDYVPLNEDTYYRDSMGERNMMYDADSTDTTAQMCGTHSSPYLHVKQTLVVIVPADITSYTGGDSMSDDSFPTVRYEITVPAGVNVADLTFSVGEQRGNAIQAGRYYVIPSLSNTFTLQETQTQAAADNDAQAGTYSIEVTDADSITASTGNMNYDVVVVDSGELTVRYVSEPEKVLGDENPVSITTPVVNNEEQVNTQNGMAVAVIEDGANFYTNGQNKNLGIVGTDATDGSGAQISLLFDDILALNKAVGEDEDAVQLLISRANAVQSGVTFTSGQYEFKYMDLVNANDGNAWVSTDKDITIFWPYPAAVKDNYSDYTFQVVHFTGLHREDYADDANGVVAQIGGAGVEVLAATATANGVKFTLKGNAENGSFSPFALVWQKTGGSSGGGGTTYYTLTYESNGGTTYEKERYASGTPVQLTKSPVREGYIFTGWYADEALTQKITSIKMTSDKTVYAGWRKSTVPDGLNGDDHFAYVIGYDDGTVKPLANIARSEVAAIFFRLLQPEIREEYLTDENPFTDVSPEDWYSKAVSTLYALDIFKGRTATTFVPDAPITRAEFAVICARFDTGLTDGNASFADIEGHWAEEEIKRAASLGWILGAPDGNFYPDQPITRAEAMTMINRVLNRIPEDESDLLDGMNVWPDNPTDAWYYLAVQEATNTHDYLPKGEIYETWTQLLEDPDWTQYQ